MMNLVILMKSGKDKGKWSTYFITLTLIYAGA